MALQLHSFGFLDTWFTTETKYFNIKLVANVSVIEHTASPRAVKHTTLISEAKNEPVKLD